MRHTRARATPPRVHDKAALFTGWTPETAALTRTAMHRNAPRTCQRQHRGSTHAIVAALAVITVVAYVAHAQPAPATAAAHDTPPGVASSPPPEPADDTAQFCAAAWPTINDGMGGFTAPFTIDENDVITNLSDQGMVAPGLLKLGDDAVECMRRIVVDPTLPFIHPAKADKVPTWVRMASRCGAAAGDASKDHAWAVDVQHRCRGFWLRGEGREYVTPGTFNAILNGTDAAGAAARVLRYFVMGDRVPQARARAAPPRPRLKVTVVGGGPVGLASALTAFQAGADVTVIERRPEYNRPIVFDLMRGDVAAHGMPTLDALLRWGMNEIRPPVTVTWLDSGAPATANSVCKDVEQHLSLVARVVGINLVRPVTYGGQSGLPVPYASQPVLPHGIALGRHSAPAPGAGLVRADASLPSIAVHAVGVTGASQLRVLADRGVVANLDDSGGNVTAHVPYHVLIACDGSKSLVRDALGSGFPPHEHAQVMLDSNGKARGGPNGTGIVRHVPGLHQTVLVLRFEVDEHGHCPVTDMPLRLMGMGAGFTMGFLVDGVATVYNRMFAPYCEIQILLTQEGSEAVGRGPGTYDSTVWGDDPGFPWHVAVAVARHTFNDTALHTEAGLRAAVHKRARDGSAYARLFDVRIHSADKLVVSPVPATSLDQVAHWPGVGMVRGDAAVTAHFRLAVGVIRGFEWLPDITNMVERLDTEVVPLLALPSGDKAGAGAGTAAAAESAAEAAAREHAWRAALRDVVERTDAEAAAKVEALVRDQTHVQLHEGYCEGMAAGGKVYSKVREEFPHETALVPRPDSMLTDPDYCAPGSLVMERLSAVERAAVRAQVEAEAAEEAAGRAAMKENAAREAAAEQPDTASSAAGDTSVSDHGAIDSGGAGGDAAASVGGAQKAGDSTEVAVDAGGGASPARSTDDPQVKQQT